MIEILAFIGLFCMSISDMSEINVDPVKARQDTLLEMLQYIRIPNISGSELAAQRYMTPRPWRTAFTKYMAGFLNGVNIDEASSWFMNDENLVIAEWETLMMLRAYHALKDNAHFTNSGAKERVEEYLHRCVEATRTTGHKVNWKLDGYWGSENHKIVQFSERLLLEEFTSANMDKDIRDQAAYQIIMWCREKALRGYTEYCSTHYTDRTLVPLLNIYDYTTDPTLRKWALMAIDQLMAEYAIFQINGFRGGAVRRCYQSDDTGYPNAELNDSTYDCMHPAGFVFFDNTDILPITYRASDQSIIYIFLATTSYRPTCVHSYLADSRKRGMLELRSGRRWDHEGSQPQNPDTYIYAWITEHYILSSIRIPSEMKWQGAVNGGVPYRISFNDSSAMIGTRVKTDVAVDPDPDDQRALFQHQNVLLFKGTVDTYRDISPLIPRGRGIDHEEIEGDYHFCWEAGLDGEIVYVSVLERNGAGIMEVRLASQHRSWKDFKNTLKNNATILNSESDIDYISCDGTHIQLKGEEIIVNDDRQVISGWPLYKSRLINGYWLNQSSEAGLLTIGNEESGTLILDFRDETKPVRKLIKPK